ncbi:MAG: transcriptional regulator FtsR [Acidimicrobiales bacterium]
MTLEQGTMRIGEVHARLRRDFPDLELSKIRYYEDKGLVRPSRSRKGYRLYSERDVACLREAIRLAQEEFVPLRVVRLRLIDQGLLSDGPVAATRVAAREAAAPAVVAPAPIPARTLTIVRPVEPELEDVPEGSDASRAAAGTRSVAELLVESGLTPDELNQVLALGILAPTIVDGQARYDERDVRVARVVRDLLAHGADPRQVRALGRVAEREVGVAAEIAGPPWAHPEAPDQRLAEVAARVAALRAELVARELEREVAARAPVPHGA